MMMACSQIQENLSLWLLDDLPESQAQQVATHLETCPQCQQEAAAWRELLGDLRSLSQPEMESEFFSRQRRSIMQGLQQEEAAATQDLVQDLQGLTVSDPGELFFRRQLKQIMQQVPSTSPKKKTFLSWKPLAVAAALFFLVVGLSRLPLWQTTPASSDWNLAVEYLAEQEEEPGGLEVLAELSPEQLDLLAKNLEGSLYREGGEIFFEEEIGYEELNDAELDWLIRRLEVKVRT